MDPAKYERIEYFIDQEGKWIAGADPARAGRATRRSTWCFRCCTAPSAKTAPCRACWNWPDLPYVGAGVLGSSVSMDKDMMKRVCQERGVAGGGLRDRHAGNAGPGSGVRAPAVSRCS